jgi:hypothetical protein
LALVGTSFRRCFPEAQVGAGKALGKQAVVGWRNDLDRRGPIATHCYAEKTLISRHISFMGNVWKTRGITVNLTAYVLFHPCQG